MANPSQQKAPESTPADPSSVQAPEVDPEDEAVDVKASDDDREYGSGNYRVLTGGIVLSTGNPKRPNESARFTHGQVLKLKEDVHDIARLVRLRAIEPAENKGDDSLKRSNALQLAHAANREAQQTNVDDHENEQPVTVTSPLAESFEQ